MIEILKSYVNLIRNEEIKTNVINLLKQPEVQNSFKSKSSLTGLYHPKDENCEYGLLLHTLRVANVVIQLARSFGDYSENSDMYDILIASALLHDVPFKNNEDNTSNYKHALDNARYFNQNTYFKNKDLKSQITTCILHHMGRWDKTNTSDFENFKPNDYSLLLHLADNISSRANISVNINSVDYLKSNLGL